MSTTTDSAQAPSMDRRNTPGPYGEPHADVNATAKGSNSASRLDTKSTKSQSQSQQSNSANESTQSVKDDQSKQQRTRSQSQSQNQAQNQPPQPSDGSKADKQQNGDGSDSQAGDKNVPPQGDEEYPEQLHAGKLDGYGPEYGSQNRTGVYERMQGVKEQIKGTIKRDPELKQRGHDRMTGELKKKQKEEEEKNDPFKNAPDSNDGKDSKDDEKDDEKKDDNDKSSRPSHPSDLQSKSQVKSQTNQAKTGTGSHPHVAQSDKGAEEQAESVRPEGQDMTQEEKEGKRRQEAGGV